MGTERDAAVDRLLDERNIYQCLVRMSRGSDRCDEELFLSSAHPDAIMAAGPFVGNPQEMYNWSSRFQREAYTATFHNLLNHHCEIVGDTAHTETYYIFAGCMGGSKNLLAGGRYVDRFERRGDVWGLMMRNNYVEWTSIVDAMASPLGEIPGLHLNGMPTQDRTDPSYERPLTNRRLRNPMTGD